MFTDFISQRDKLNEELKDHALQIALQKDGKESSVESGANPRESAVRVRREKKKMPFPELGELLADLESVYASGWEC